MERTNLQKTVTKNMRVALAANGLQQKDLAAAIGITSASMSAKFTGKANWNLVDIEKASDFFNVKPEALVAGHGAQRATELLHPASACLAAALSTIGAVYGKSNRRVVHGVPCALDT